MRGRIWLVALALPAALAAQQKCPAIAAADQARLENYLARQYSLPGGATLSLVSNVPLPGSCVRQVTFAADWPRITVTVMLSPDGQYAFPGAYDLSKSPVPPARLAAAAASSGPAPLAPLNAERFGEIARGTPLVFGPATAPVTIVEFSDFECPFCKQLAVTLRHDLLPAHAQDVRLVYRQFPLNIHPWARAAAEMTDCVAAQSDDAFWGLHDFLFDRQEELNAGNLRVQVNKFIASQHGVDQRKFDTCVETHAEAARVQADMALGNELGVHATPTYFINGAPNSGAKTLGQLEAAVTAAKGTGSARP